MSIRFGFMGFQAGNSPENATQFMVRQILRGEVSTAMIVKIAAVDTKTQTVDVVPMVTQVSATGVPIPHSTIHGVPYAYQQAGVAAIQIPPNIGDMGIVVCAQRDITRVKATKAPAPPSTLRTHHLSDAMYVATLWTGQKPKHIISLDQKTGITITSSETVTINAKSQFNGDMSIKGKVTATGDVEAGGISLQNHVHPGVQPGPGETGKAQ